MHATFLCDHTTGCEAYSFMTDGHVIFNMHTYLGACCTHEGGSGTNKPTQELTRGETENLSLILSHQWIEPSVRIISPTLYHWAMSPVDIHNLSKHQWRTKHQIKRQITHFQFYILIWTSPQNLQHNYNPIIQWQESYLWVKTNTLVQKSNVKVSQTLKKCHAPNPRNTAITNHTYAVMSALSFKIDCSPT